MTKKIGMAVIVLLFFTYAAGLFALSPISAQAPEEALADKLDALLEGQRVIMQELKTLKEEITGIKYQTNKL